MALRQFFQNAMIFNKKYIVKLYKMIFLWILKDSNYDNLVYVGNIMPCDFSQKQLKNWKLSKIRDMHRTEKTLSMYVSDF